MDTQNGRQAGKRGMKKTSRRAKLRFGDILVQGVLPPLPEGKWFGHLSNHEPFDWGMLGNDQAGDCVVAGACHETMVLNHASGRPVPLFTPANALAVYSQLIVSEGGQPYNPTDPGTDTGLDPIQAAEYRRSHGITDANGVLHKIDAYAAINNWGEALHAVDLFGVVGLGLALPDDAEDQFNAGQQWDNLSGKPGDGHYVPAAMLNSRGSLVMITWGNLQGATPQWFDKYCDTMIAYISKEYMLANGKSPEAIDWATLENYLKTVPTA